MDATHKELAWELIDGTPIVGAPLLRRRDRRRFVRRARRRGMDDAAIAAALAVAVEEVKVLAAEDPDSDDVDDGNPAV